MTRETGTMPKIIKPRHATKALAAAALALLAACGGGGSGTGGGGGGSAVAPGAVAATGSSPPQETVAGVSARVAGIVSRTDSVVASTVFGETSSPELPAFRLRPSCSGTACTYTNRQIGLAVTAGLGNLDLGSSRQRAVLTRRGITLLEGSGDGTRSYGAWMRHGAFGTLRA